MVSEDIRRIFATLQDKWTKLGNPMGGVWVLPDPQEKVILLTDASDELTGYLIRNGKEEVLYDSLQIIPDKSQINLGELDAVIFGLQACLLDIYDHW